MDSLFRQQRDGAGSSSNRITYQPVTTTVHAPRDTHFHEETPWDYKQQYAAHSSELPPRSHRNHHYNHRPKSGLLEGNWGWEWMSLAFGVACMAGIVGVLVAFEGQSLEEWNGRVAFGRGGSGFEISPNVVVSVLGSLTKSCVALVVASCISQAKWNWFSYKSRPLEDMQTFDDGSRGPLGALKLIWRTRVVDSACGDLPTAIRFPDSAVSNSLTLTGSKIVSLGALATVLALAFDPFLQLVIFYPIEIRVAPQENQTLARAERFEDGFLTLYPAFSEEGVSNETFGNDPSPDGNVYFLTDSFPGSDILASVYNGFLLANESRRNPVSSCTGNCTFPTFASLAVCSRCVDVTDSLLRSDAGEITYVYNYQTDAFNAESVEYALDSRFPLRLLNPYGFIINDTFARTDRQEGDSYIPMYGSDMTVRASSNPRETINFQDSQTLLYSIQMILVDRAYVRNETAWENADVTAWECGLSMCINQYDSQIVNGRLEEKVRQSWSTKEPRSWEVFPERQFQSSAAPNETLTNLSSSLIGDLDWNPLYQPFYMNRSDFQLVIPDGEGDLFAGSGPYNMTQSAIDSTIDLFLDVLNFTNVNFELSSLGVLGDGTFSDEVAQEAGATYAVIHTSNVTYFSSNFMIALYENGNLSATFDNIAHDLSSAIRNAGSLQTLGYLENNVTVIRVRWAFLSLPIAVVLLSVLLFAGLMVQTNGAGTEIWKEGALASFIYGVDARSREGIRAECNSGGFGAAGRRRVKLENDGDGWTLRER